MKSSATTTKTRNASTPAQAPRFLGRGRHVARGARLPLAQIRKSWGKTQVEVAEAATMAQADVSRLEHRPTGELTIPTLERYARSLGAHIEVVVVFDNTGHRVVIGEPEGVDIALRPA